MIKMIKIYLASKWENREAIKNMMSYIIGHGFKITTDWTTHTDFSQSQLYSMIDLDGVKDCDVLIVYAPTKLPYKGTYVELGIALGLDKDIYIIGNGIDECVFSKHPNIKKNNSISSVVKDIVRRKL